MRKFTQLKSELKQKLFVLSGILILSMSLLSAQDTVTYLSDLNWRIGYGFGGGWDYTWFSGIKKDIDFAGFPRNELSIRGVQYAKGISVSTYSEICYDLQKQYSRFLSDIGIEDSRPTGSVIFKVFCDGKLAYQSAAITATMNAVKVNIPVQNVSELKLVVTDVTNASFPSYVMANWANARLKPGIALTTDTQETKKILYIGNSLCTGQLLNNTMAYASSSGFKHTWDICNTYHDQLKDQWTAGTNALAPRGLIMSGNYTHCVIQPNSTEYGDAPWTLAGRDSLKKYSKLFYDLAKSYNMTVFLYCYWPHQVDPMIEQNNIDSVFKVVANNCGPDVVMIPVGRTYYNLRQAYLNGVFTDWNPAMWYVDNVHLSWFGHYINSLVHFATVYKQSPEGLQTYNSMVNTPTINDSTVKNVSDETILKIQKIVWNTVKTYTQTKVDTSNLPVAKLLSNKTIANIDSSITFNASLSSSAPGSSIVKYRWTFGDEISPTYHANSITGLTGLDSGHVVPFYETTSTEISHTYSQPGNYIARLVVVQADGNTSSSYIIITITADSIDIITPSTPTNLVASNVTKIDYTLSWTASTDNVGVIGYEIYKDGVLCGFTTSTSINITDLVTNTAYTMTVKAKDAAGNVSNVSSELIVTTVSTSIKTNDVGITVYPNPAINVLNISGIEIGSVISIFDLNGILQLQKNAENNLSQIDVSSLNKGVYIVKIMNDRGVVIEKFVKE